MLVIDPVKAVKVLALAVLGLLVGHAIGMTLRFGLDDPFGWGLVRLFDFDSEANFPTFFSSALLMSSAALSGLIGLVHYQRRQPEWVAWGGIALAFCFVSLDEAIGLHEKLIAPIRGMLGLSGFLYFAWVIPYGLLVCLLIACYGRFVFRLPPLVRRLTFLSAGVFLSGALGFEFIGGYYFERVKERVDLTYALLTTAEELLEMAGVLIFLYGQLLYAKMRLDGIGIHIAPDVPPGPGREASALEGKRLQPDPQHGRTGMRGLAEAPKARRRGEGPMPAEAGHPPLESRTPPTLSRQDDVDTLAGAGGGPRGKSNEGEPGSGA